RNAHSFAPRAFCGRSVQLSNRLRSCPETNLGAAAAGLGRERARVRAREKMSSSVVFFHPGPQWMQIAGYPATKENIEMLAPPRVRMFGVAGDFNALEMF